jgi:hypothetical protein
VLAAPPHPVGLIRSGALRFALLPPCKFPRLAVLLRSFLLLALELLRAQDRVSVDDESMTNDQGLTAATGDRALDLLLLS